MSCNKRPLHVKAHLFIDVEMILDECTRVEENENKRGNDDGKKELKKWDIELKT